MRRAYKGIDWKTGVHDCRAIGYEHPWLAVCRDTGEVAGCWSREEARRVLARLKRGFPAESAVQ